MFLNNSSRSDHLVPTKRRPSTLETTNLSLLFRTFENTLRLRLLSLIPTPKPSFTLPYLSRAVDVLASTHADARALLSDPSLSDSAAFSSYLDTSLILLEACNTVSAEIERHRRRNLHLGLASHLLLPNVSNKGAPHDSISEWEKELATGAIKQIPLRGKNGVRSSNPMSAISRAIYAVEAVSSLVAGLVVSAVGGGGGGGSGVRVPGEFAWAGAYNELAAEICRGGGGRGELEVVEEMCAVRFNVRRLTVAMDDDGEGGERTETMLGCPVKELEVSVGRLTEGLDCLGHAVSGLFRSAMATRTTALGRFPVGPKTCK